MSPFQTFSGDFHIIGVFIIKILQYVVNGNKNDSNGEKVKLFATRISK